MNASNMYQKVVLTVIAIAAVGIVLQNQIIIGKMNDATTQTIQQSPQQQSQPVNFQTVSTTRMSYAIVPVNADGSLNVRVKEIAETMDVNLTKISTSDKLNTEIKGVDSWAFFNCTVPVKIKD